MGGKPVMSFSVGVPEGCKAGDFVHNRDNIGIVCGEFGVLGFDREGAQLAAKKLAEYARGFLGGAIDLDGRGKDYARGEGGTVLKLAGKPKRVKNAKGRR